MSERVQDAVYIARRAGRMILRMRQDAKSSIKADGSFVTDADIASQEYILQELQKRYPDDGVLAEEGDHPEASCEQDRPIWIVDPLDGTDAFRMGLAYFCVSIGLFERGRFSLGVLYVPVLDETFSVGEGHPPSLNGETLAVTESTELRDHSLLAAPSNFHRNFTSEFPGKIRSLGSTAYHFALVARGGAVGGLPWGHLWDVAAGVALVEAAGGKVARLDGSEIDYADYLDGRKMPVDILAAPTSLFSAVSETLSLRAR